MECRECRFTYDPLACRQCEEPIDPSAPCQKCGKAAIGLNCPKCSSPGEKRDALKWLPEWEGEGALPELEQGLDLFLDSFDTLAKDDNGTPGWTETDAFFAANSIPGRERPVWRQLWRGIRDEQRADLRRRRESASTKGKAPGA